jgi:hypothetical protein
VEVDGDELLGRVAHDPHGFTFLFYIALGIPTMVLLGRATNAQGIAAKLAGIAQHATEVRVAVVLILFTSFAALVLGVTMYAITRDEDPDLAMLALTCRIGEGLAGGLSIQRTLGLLWLATATGANAPNTEAVHALGAFLLAGQGPAAMFFAVGSTLFSWLLLRGRMIPVVLAWLGVFASLLMVVGPPLQILGVLGDSATWIMWIPMAAFGIPLAFWLIIKGVPAPASRRA